MCACAPRHHFPQKPAEGKAKMLSPKTPGLFSAKNSLLSYLSIAISTYRWEEEEEEKESMILPI